jgi:hypothetical protein
MFNSFRRVSVVVVLAVFSLISAANAQNAVQAPKLAKPANLHPGNGSSGDGVGGGFSPYNYGWNYVHATHCYMYDQDGYTYLFLYPQEGGQFWTTSAPYQNLIMAACQTGNWIAFDAYDSYGDWAEVYTYDYK